jgi:hypothetical protein
VAQGESPEFKPQYHKKKKIYIYRTWTFLIFIEWHRREVNVKYKWIDMCL